MLSLLKCLNVLKILKGKVMKSDTAVYRVVIRCHTFDYFDNLGDAWAAFRFLEDRYPSDLVSIHKVSRNITHQGEAFSADFIPELKRIFHGKDETAPDF